MALLSRQRGSSHCCSSSRQELTTIPNPTGERKNFLSLSNLRLHWPPYLALHHLNFWERVARPLKTEPKLISFPLRLWLYPANPHSTGTFVASHSCLVERIFWLFPRWLSPHLDDFTPVNINFVMAMTPTGLQVWWNHRECLAPCIPHLLETTLLVKARHGQGSLELCLSLSLPQDFFLTVLFAKRPLHDIQPLLRLWILKLSSSWAENISLPIHKGLFLHLIFIRIQIFGRETSSWWGLDGIHRIWPAKKDEDARRKVVKLGTGLCQNRKLRQTDLLTSWQPHTTFK